MQLFAERGKDNYQKTPTIAFLGDSVTQGCFEVYWKNEDQCEAVFDQNHAYHKYVAQILATLYPSVPVTIINAGISGSRTGHAVDRLHRDVISHQPDLAVVCFGLNDVCSGEKGIDIYGANLEAIFTELQKHNIEVVFMTPNMMNTYVDYNIDPSFKDFAETTATAQNSGMMDNYMNRAKEVCEKCGVVVCDCYAKWKTLQENGADVTALLSNKINHPSREMNWLFAYSLVETFMK